MSHVSHMLNRLKRRIGRLKHVIFRGPGIRKYANNAYTLAARLPEPRHDQTTPWLSIIIPAYQSNRAHLKELVASYFGQSRAGVELIFVEDASPDGQTARYLESLVGEGGVSVIIRPENGGIAAATMTGLDRACGSFVAFLDHDDVIAPHALKVIWHTINDHPDVAFLYTDELVIDKRSQPFNHITKPAFDPVLLSSVNYINHFSVYRRDRLAALGGLREGYDGSQDYDLVLRYVRGLDEAKILHLPYPAYWWRHTEDNYSLNHFQRSIGHARNALQEHFAALGRPADIGEAMNPMHHRVHFRRNAGDWPHLSIIIPSKNGCNFIRQTLAGIFEKTDYPVFDVLVIDNGSDDPEVLALYQHYERHYQNFAVHIKTEPFNFARSVNRGLALAAPGPVLLLNNDVEVIEPGWLKELVACLDFERTGIVGAKLLYPDNTLQHAGVIVGQNALAGHWFYKEKRDYDGPIKRLHGRSSMACVTGAAMVLSQSCREALGDWDEINFAIAYNDVDYCLRAYKAGFRIVWTPFAELYHHESATRGPEKDPKKAARFKREKQALQCIHDTDIFEDPAHSPWFSKRSSRIRFRSLSALPKPRTWWP